MGGTGVRAGYSLIDGQQHRRTGPVCYLGCCDNQEYVFSQHIVHARDDNKLSG